MGRSWAVIAGLVLVACGGGAAAGSGSTTPAETASETEGFEPMEGDEGTASRQSAREAIGIHSPERAWDALSVEERQWWMISNVMPIHGEMFREYDASRYSEITCATCHGDDAEAHHFEMPSNALPRIPAPGTPAYQAMTERNPRGVEFMEQQILPTIRTQIGEQDLTCFACHPHAS